MSDWGTGGTGGNFWGAGTSGNAASDSWGTPAATASNDPPASNWDAPSGDNAGGPCHSCGQTGHDDTTCHNGVHGPETATAEDNGDKCYSCGEMGHRAAECPTPRDMNCRYCKLPGHLVRDCPDKPPMVCENCGEDGHMRKNCENARKINRDHVADISAEAAWEKIKQAVSDRDPDDVKESIQEYVKALNGEVTFRQLQEGLIGSNIGLWLIATERSLINVFTNMDLQGNTGKKYSISYRFSEKPDRPREAESWPQSRDELLSRLDDAGDIVNSGLPRCYQCGEIGHTSKVCTEEKPERTDQPKICCSNCGADGHRMRDCTEPRVDKFACKNCGKSGHKVAECEEPPNLDNVECRKCNEKGHFAKDCPQGGGRACRNCGQEGHIAKECTEPRNMDSVTCRNCEKTGHISRECPEPKDWSKVQCSNCQEFGHTKVRCKQPLKDDEDAVSTIGGGDHINDTFTATPATTGFEDTASHYDGGGGGGGGDW